MLQILGSGLFAKEKESLLKLSMYGDLDDDLIIVKSKNNNNKILDIYQMHNSKNEFIYEGNIYKSKINNGFMQFSKKYKIEDDEVMCVFTANEMDDAGYEINKRIRTHYKNENILINDNILLKALMPEYKSVENYPLWFNEGDKAFIEREDINGKPYNYYNLFENSTIQTGIILQKEENIKIMLFDKNSELVYTFEEKAEKKPKYIKSKEFKNGELKDHDFIEVGNILNENIDNQIENSNYITEMIIQREKTSHKITFPYPMMYPNLISIVCVE